MLKETPVTQKQPDACRRKQEKIAKAKDEHEKPPKMVTVAPPPDRHSERLADIIVMAYALRAQAHALAADAREIIAEFKRIDADLESTMAEYRACRSGRCHDRKRRLGLD